MPNVKQSHKYKNLNDKNYLKLVISFLGFHLTFEI